MNCYVTDASFLIKCIVPEEHSSTVIAFALKGYELIVPDLFYPETANILWKKARCGEMQKDEVWQALNQLQLLELTVISNKSLMDLATDIALSQGCSVYDGTYLAAAIKQDCPLVTADRRFYNNLKNGQYASHFLWIEEAV
ncbi:MAG: PIN domain nuclease [Candidatus Parabeggiatoa sp. nov. 1]|nr:MAG: PIN domain nuclease [Gammaproteobacteria bacterium]